MPLWPTTFINHLWKVILTSINFICKLRGIKLFTEHRSLFRNPVGYPTSRTRVRRSPYHLPPRPSLRLWTHKFYCLASMRATSVPTTKPVKDALATAGLGEKSLSIPMAGTPSDLHQHLLRLYPPLADCGGYTLLRCAGNSKNLLVVQPPPGGHSADTLAAAVGQSRVYIRPLQRDIPLLQRNQSQQVTANRCAMHITFHTVGA